MRKKKHLDERLAACAAVNLGWLPDGIHEVNNAQPIIPSELFGNDRPLRIEIGCGKGRFVNEAAAREPDVNFIAVEQTANVIVSAMEHTLSLELPNLRYLMGNAAHLHKVLPPGSVSMIYLNFSCPFPKTRCAKHRLTHPDFLGMYKGLLAKGGTIRQKTDDPRFFEFSLKNLSQCGFVLEEVTLDLHNSDVSGNIITEYEQRFLDLGLPIYYLEAVKND